MYDFDTNLPFPIEMNIETITLLLNFGIPLLYFANFFYLIYKLRGMDKDAPFYSFMRSLVYFFFFYSLGALFFVWYDFYYMDFESPNPISVLWGDIEAPLIEAVHFWKIGILLTNVGMLLMIIQLRKKIFKKKIYLWLPIVWELGGITMIILIGFVPIPILGDDPYFYAEIFFLFNFVWSVSLPLAYSIVWKSAAGKMRRYAFILFFCFISYGVAWGFRTRFAVHMTLAILSLIPNSPWDYHLIWLVRSGVIIISLTLILYAYRKLLKEF